MVTVVIAKTSHIRIVVIAGSISIMYVVRFAIAKFSGTLLLFSKILTNDLTIYHIKTRYSSPLVFCYSDKNWLKEHIMYTGSPCPD